MSPTFTKDYTLSGTVTANLYEKSSGLLTLIQYQTVTLYKVSPSGKKTQIGSSSSFANLLDVGQGIYIVPAKININGQVQVPTGYHLELGVVWGGVLSLQSMTIYESPSFPSDVVLPNPIY